MRVGFNWRLASRKNKFAIYGKRSVIGFTMEMKPDLRWRSESVYASDD
jgi:hypothetical protein